MFCGVEDWAAVGALSCVLYCAHACPNHACPNAYTHTMANASARATHSCTDTFPHTNAYTTHTSASPSANTTHPLPNPLPNTHARSWNPSQDIVRRVGRSTRA